MVAPTSAAPAAVRGRVVDVDAHAMLMPDVYPEILGPAFGEPMRRWAQTRVGDLDDATFAAQRSAARTDVLRTKGWLAHGADDPADRVEALDQMGVARQLVFPPIPLPFLHGAHADAVDARRRWNDAMHEWAAGGHGRLTSVAQLGLADVDDALREAARLTALGTRAVEIPFAQPPAGRSPADPTWDRLWGTLADNGIAVLLHVGGGGLGGGFGPDRSFTDPRWAGGGRLRAHDGTGAPASGPTSSDGGGDTDRDTDRDTDGIVGRFDALGPLDRAVRHHGAETFVGALILGGVLERHPSLAVGIIELGAGWVGSWVEQLDDAASALRTYGLEPLPELPSTYVRRQVRVTPTYGEPVGRYLERTDLGEVYAFSTDYPHYEGGKDPFGWSARALDGASADTREHWFVTNGSLLAPAS